VQAKIISLTINQSDGCANIPIKRYSTEPELLHFFFVKLPLCW